MVQLTGDRCDYQTTVFGTSGFAVPERVSVAMNEIATDRGSKG